MHKLKVMPLYNIRIRKLLSFKLDVRVGSWRLCERSRRNNVVHVVGEEEDAGDDDGCQ